MWILHQYNEKFNKYIVSQSYNAIMDYINTFDNIKRITEFFYKSNDIYFKIHLGEEIIENGK